VNSGDERTIAGCPILRFARIITHGDATMHADRELALLVVAPVEMRQVITAIV